jgi:hypothetical protein
MVAVKEITWEEAMSPEFGNPARQAWREAVAEIAAKAKETLPQCSGRVESAVKIVLAGDVELLEDGEAKVASQSNGTTTYVVVNGECQCKDYPKAPSQWCKHRIAAGIQKRATVYAKQKLAQLDGASTGQAEAPSQAAPAQPPAALPLATQADIDQCVHESVQEALTTLQPALPEAPASANCYVTLAGRKVQVTLRDSDEQRLLERLETLLQRFPAEAEPEGEQAQPEGWCRKHGVQMKLNHGKDGSTWYSHKTTDGWCKGR